MKGNFAALVLVLIGSVALGNNLGWFDISLSAILRTWWPVIPISVGLALFLTPGDDTRKS